MKKEYLTIDSACDGLPLSVAVFAPEGEVKGIIQFAHGMAEHKERYYGFMEYLAEQGYASAINDHRGHGGSVKSKEDLGYFYDETSDFIVEDLHQLTLAVKEKFPGKPVYLFGHSMGSLTVRKYIKKYDGEIKKLIVCGSPSKNPLVGSALSIVALQKAFKGDRYRSRFIQKMAFGSYNKNLKDVSSGNSWLSANLENVKTYDKDGMCGFTFTLNGFRNLFLLMKQVYEPQGWLMKNKDLSIWFIAGGDDPVIAGESNWLQAQEFLKSMGYNNVTGKLYPGLRHEILNEACATDIYKDVLNYIEA